MKRYLDILQRQKTMLSNTGPKNQIIPIYPSKVMNELELFMGMSVREEIPKGYT